MLLEERPRGTSLVILSGADEIESAEDRQLINRTVHNWLIPIEKTGTFELVDIGVFQWSDRPEKPDDRGALKERLNAPLSDAAHDSLRVRRLAMAIQRIQESALPQQNPATTFNLPGDHVSVIRTNILQRTRDMRDDAEWPWAWPLKTFKVVLSGNYPDCPLTRLTGRVLSAEKEPGIHRQRVGARPGGMCGGPNPAAGAGREYC